MDIKRIALLGAASAMGLAPFLIGCGSELQPTPMASAVEASPRRVAGTFDPASPEISGYRQVFADDFHSLSTIDLRNTRQSNYKWFIQPFFGGRPKPDASITMQNGKVVLQDVEISTAAPGAFGHTTVGRAFGGGGYFEVTYSEGPKTPQAKGYPAFWGMAIEHLAGGGGDRDQTGKNQGTRYIEDDFSERDTAFADPSSYAATMIEWYGHWRQDCPATQYCRIWNHGSNGLNNWVIRPGVVDWSTPHRVGQLWQPAAANQDGFVQNYFDGRPVGTPVTWTANIGSPYEVIDHQHLAIFLHAGDQQMILENFAVWQR